MSSRSQLKSFNPTPIARWPGKGASDMRAAFLSEPDRGDEKETLQHKGA
jgi:hypothetical protein